MAICYGATALTGGGTGALDRAELDGDILNNGDVALVALSDDRCILYRLDATSGATEAPPHIIAPDVNPGTKRWISLGMVDITLGSDADGDIYIRSGGHLTRLPAGSNGQILELSSGLPSWQEGAMKKSVYDTGDNGIVDKAEGIELGSDADGDIYYRNSGALQRLPIGSNGQLLEVVSGLPAWETPTAGIDWTGFSFPFRGESVPAGFLENDGSLISITTYENLYDKIGNSYGLNTGVNFTASAGDDTITSAAHGKSNDDIIEMTNSGGALPAGLAIDTKYFIINVTTDTFQVSLTQGGAAVDITDTGTGTHSFHDQIAIPDDRGEFLRGYDHGAGNDPDAASRTDRGDGETGDKVGTKQGDEVEAHTHGSAGAHTHTLYDSGAMGSGFPTTNISARGSNTGQTESSGAHTHSSVGGNENRPRNISVMWCIKY